MASPVSPSSNEMDWESSAKSSGIQNLPERRSERKASLISRDSFHEKEKIQQDNVKPAQAVKKLRPVTPITITTKPPKTEQMADVDGLTEGLKSFNFDERSSQVNKNPVSISSELDRPVKQGQMWHHSRKVFEYIHNISQNNNK